MNAQQGMWGRRAVYFLLVSLMVACAMQNDAFADYKKWSKKVRKEVESTPGTVIQSTTHCGHTTTICTIFQGLNVNCCKLDAVSERDEYVDAVSNHGAVPKKYLYSLTHGHGLTLQQTPPEFVDRHLFQSLALITNLEATITLAALPVERQVYPSDLPDDLEYDFVLLAACHSAHDVGDQQQNGDARSFAPDMRAKFNARVFIGAKGGTIDQVAPRCCVYASNSKAFALEFMTKLNTYALTHTFDQCFGMVSTSTSCYFRIVVGKDLPVEDVFPVQ